MFSLQSSAVHMWSKSTSCFCFVFGYPQLDFSLPVDELIIESAAKPWDIFLVSTTFVACNDRQLRYQCELTVVAKKCRRAINLGCSGISCCVCVDHSVWNEHDNELFANRRRVECVVRRAPDTCSSDVSHQKGSSKLCPTPCHQKSPQQ